MVEYRYEKSDYLITMYYQGKKYRFIARQYHTDRHARYFYLFAKGRILDLKYNVSDKTLTEELLEGQPASPKDFLDALFKEFVQIQERSFK